MNSERDYRGREFKGRPPETSAQKAIRLTEEIHTDNVTYDMSLGEYPFASSDGTPTTICFKKNLREQDSTTYSIILTSEVFGHKKTIAEIHHENGQTTALGDTSPFLGGESDTPVYILHEQDSLFGRKSRQESMSDVNALQMFAKIREGLGGAWPQRAASPDVAHSEDSQDLVTRLFQDVSGSLADKQRIRETEWREGDNEYHIMTRTDIPSSSTKVEYRRLKKSKENDGIPLNDILQVVLDPDDTPRAAVFQCYEHSDIDRTEDPEVKKYRNRVNGAYLAELDTIGGVFPEAIPEQINECLDTLSTKAERIAKRKEDFRSVKEGSEHIHAIDVVRVDSTAGRYPLDQGEMLQVSYISDSLKDASITFLDQNGEKFRSLSFDMDDRLIEEYDVVQSGLESFFSGEEMESQNVSESTSDIPGQRFLRNNEAIEQLYDIRRQLGNRWPQDLELPRISDDMNAAAVTEQTKDLFSEVAKRLSQTRRFDSDDPMRPSFRLVKESDFYVGENANIGIQTTEIDGVVEKVNIQNSQTNKTPQGIRLIDSQGVIFFGDREPQFNASISVLSVPNDLSPETNTLLNDIARLSRETKRIEIQQGRPLADEEQIAAAKAQLQRATIVAEEIRAHFELSKIQTDETMQQDEELDSEPDMGMDDQSIDEAEKGRPKDDGTWIDNDKSK